MSVERFLATTAEQQIVAELAASAPTNPFVTPSFFESRRQVGYVPWVLCLREADGRLVRGCGGFTTTGRLNRTLEIPSLPAVSADSPFWNGLRAFCREQGITTLELDSFGSPPGVEIPELGTHFTRRDRQEFLLDLTADLSALLGSNHKRNVKKAQKAGVTITRTRSPEASGAHHALMGQSLDRRRERGEQVSFDAESLDHAAYLRSGAGELFQAVRDGTVLSSVLVLRAAKSGYYQSAGTSADGMSMGASHFLIHGIALQLRADGATLFNLGGADDESSLARFKAGFGAASVKLTSASCYVGARWRRIATRGLHLVRNDRAALRRVLVGERSRLIVYAIDSGEARVEDAPAGLSIRPLAAEEVRSLPVSDASFRARQIERLDRFGDSYAYGVFADGQLAHVSWLLPPAAMRRDPPHVIEARAGNAEITASETLPEFRGRGLYAYAVRSLVAVARELGMQRVFMKAHADNAASHSGIVKGGLTRVGSATLIVLPLIQRQTIWRRF